MIDLFNYQRAQEQANEDATTRACIELLLDMVNTQRADRERLELLKKKAAQLAAQLN